MHLFPPEFGRNCMYQNSAVHKAFSPSPHRRWTSLILSADLQIPLQLQSKEATQMLPAWAFHSQSVVANGNTKLFKLHIPFNIRTIFLLSLLFCCNLHHAHRSKHVTKNKCIANRWWHGGGRLMPINLFLCFWVEHLESLVQAFPNQCRCTTSKS